MNDAFFRRDDAGKQHLARMMPSHNIAAIFSRIVGHSRSATGGASDIFRGKFVLGSSHSS